MTVAEVARRYVSEYGWSVVPLSPETKRPMVSWKPFQRRRPDAARLAAWLAARPSAGIAVVCGEVSGRLVILDLDEGHDNGASGRTTLEARGYTLPQAPTVHTPSGGTHLYLRWPEGLPMPRPRAGKDACSEPMPGVDLRGEASYAAAPPSRRRGGGWVWVDGVRMPLPEAPDWLVRLYTPQAVGQQPGTPPAPQPTGLARLLAEPCPPGTRHDTALRIAGALARRGMGADELAAMMEGWRLRCCPDHDAADTARIASDIAAARKTARAQPTTTTNEAISAGLQALVAIGATVEAEEEAAKLAGLPAKTVAAAVPTALCADAGLQATEKALEAWCRARGIPGLRHGDLARILAGLPPAPPAAEVMAQVAVVYARRCSTPEDDKFRRALELFAGPPAPAPETATTWIARVAAMRIVQAILDRAAAEDNLPAAGTPQRE